MGSRQDFFAWDVTSFVQTPEERETVGARQGRTEGRKFRSGNNVQCSRYYGKCTNRERVVMSEQAKSAKGVEVKPGVVEGRFAKK